MHGATQCKLKITFLCIMKFKLFSPQESNEQRKTCRRIINMQLFLFYLKQLQRTSAKIPTKVAWLL